MRARAPRSKKAAAQYQKACDKGSAFGCNNLGVLAAEGRGVPKNLRRAEELFKKGCDKGNATACRNVQRAPRVKAAEEARKKAEEERRKAELAHHGGVVGGVMLGDESFEAILQSNTH